MADSVKNVTFTFKADTSQLSAAIQAINTQLQSLRSNTGNLKLTADSKPVINELNKLNAELEKVKNNASKPVNIGFLDTLKGGLAAFGIVATTQSLVDLGKSTIQAAVDFEKLTASFRALIGDKERADQAIVDIQKFALETPFDVTQIAAAGKTLLGYGISVNDLLPTLKQLGDVSAASGGDIQRVALAFGQVSAKGKLQGEEIRQLVNIGFNPLQEISKATGESMSALAKRVEEGRVSFEEVAEAFRVATSEGGRFFNLAATLNDTFGGQLQKLTEQINLFKIEVGTAAAEDLRPLVEGLVIIFNRLTETAKAIRENVIALGIFKGVVGFIVALLFTSANAFVLNYLKLKTWKDMIDIFRIRMLYLNDTLNKNNLLITTNTQTTKVATIATNVWNTSMKVIGGTINIVGNGLKALWGIIAANPIGVAILLFQALNAVLDDNAKKSRAAWLESKNLADANKLLADFQNNEAQAIAAINGALDDQYKTIINLAKTKKGGFLSEEVRAALEELGTQQKIDISGLLDIRGDENKFRNQLRAIIEDLKQKQVLEINVSAAQNELAALRGELAKADEQFLEFKDLLDKEFGGKFLERLKDESEGLGAFENNAKQAKNTYQRLVSLFSSYAPLGAAPGDIIVPRRVQTKDLQEEGTRYVDAINSYLKKIEQAEDKLQKAQERLIGLSVGRPAKDKKDPLKKDKDYLEDLRKLIARLISDIDKLNSKKISLQIENMPEDTEEQQRQKAVAQLEETRRLNKKEAAEERRQATTLYDIAIKNGEDKNEAKRLYGDALTEIQNRYNASEEINTITHQKRIFEIVKFWNDRNKENLDKTRKEETEEYLRQLERREQGLQEIQTDIEERFVKAPPGGGKELRQRFKDITAALQDNLQEQLNVRKANRVIEFTDEKADARKRYELQIANIQETGEERTKQEARYWQQYLDEIGERQLKFDNDILQMEQDTADRQFDIGKGNAEKFKQLEKERKLAIIDGIQQTVDAAIQAAQQIIDIEQRKNDELIALQEQRVEKAREIADKGNAALLEAEEKRLTELQKKRARFVRAQQALILAQMIAESALAIARAAAEGGGFLSAVTVAATVAALAAGIAAARAQSTAAIGGFAEGGWTGKGGKYEPAGVVHREEFVVKKGPAEKFRPMLEQMNRGRDPLLAAGMGQQVIMINNVGVEERLSRIEKAITGQDRMQLTIDESGIHGIVSHYQWKNQRIRNKTR